MIEQVGIIGLGRLGLCLALNLEDAGLKIQGVESNIKLTKSIIDKSIKSKEPELENLLKNSSLIPKSNIDQDFITQNNLLFVVVATPTSNDGTYDHKQVDEVAYQLMKFGKQIQRKHLIINCTTLPGYCDSLSEKLEQYNYSVSYNPEFIAQGSIIHDQRFPDQILIGTNEKEVEIALREIYGKLVRKEVEYCIMSPLSAEICKLATNCFLTNKIAFANAIGDLAVSVGAEPNKILQAIGSDSRIGNKYLGYGFGFGGPCFPRDNRALNHYAKKQNTSLLLSEATDQSNANHLDFQFKQYLKIPEHESIEFDSITYKKGSEIIEESQQLALAIKLAEAGRKVIIHEQEKLIEYLENTYGNLFEYVRRN